MTPDRPETNRMPRDRADRPRPGARGDRPETPRARPRGEKYVRGGPDPRERRDEEDEERNAKRFGRDDRFGDREFNAPEREIFPDELLFDGPQDGPRFLMAHGAGAGMEHPWMEQMTALLVERDVGVIRFEFPYMQIMRRTGGRRPPDPEDRLLQCYCEAVEYVGDPANLFIGGKSMGGRMASLLADELEPRGLICLGFPFHGLGKPMDKDRLLPLKTMKTPSLIVQGTRDAMGSQYEIEFSRIAATVRIAFMEDGDHSFSPRRISGRTLDQNMAAAADAVARFMKSDRPGVRLKRARLVRPS